MSEAPESKIKTTSDIVWAISEDLKRENFGTGPLAQLKRIDPDGALAEPAFQRLLARHLGERDVSPREMKRWALIIGGMARLTPDLHQSKEPLGRSLYEAGYSEARLLRLLEAREVQLEALAGRLPRFMAGKRAAMNFKHFARFVLAEGRNEKTAEEMRIKLARDFYIAEAKKERASADAQEGKKTAA